MTSQRIVVGAHYGLIDWLAQRISAIVIAAYALLWLVLLFCVSFPLDFAHWRELMASAWMSTATFVFLIALMWHAWVGVRDIVMDYIKSPALRLVLYVCVLLALAAQLSWVLRMLWFL